MEKLIQERMSRPVVGIILLFAAVFSLLGAAFLDVAGLESSTMGPLPFVTAVIFIKLGLFAFWPAMVRKSREASLIFSGALPREALFSRSSKWRGPERRGGASQSEIKRRRTKKNQIRLWDAADSRIDISLFSHNVPTFVIDAEQRFIDWNPAFDLVFGKAQGLKPGAHIQNWFDLLDNFKRVSVRTKKLYGEGILPMADRERATYISPVFGRMVFTKIMTPIVDRTTGRILGWNVVLNINSVGKRQFFFEKLYGRIAQETRHIRYAAAVDGLMENYGPYQVMLARHVAQVKEGAKVLDLGAGTGSLTKLLVRKRCRVTAVDHNVHTLRRLRNKCRSRSHRLHIVRCDPELLTRVPADRFDAVTMNHLAYKLEDLSDCLAKVFKTLKPGGILTMSSILPSGGLEQLYTAVKHELAAKGLHDHLKHQFNHVLEYEKEVGRRLPYRFRTRGDLRAALLENGFVIATEESQLLDGHGLLIVARKP